MKNLTAVIVAFLLCGLFTKPAVAQIFEQDKSYVSIGYGFGTLIGAIAATITANINDERYTYSITGPLYAKYEYGITEKFGIGVNLAFVQFKFNYKYQEYDPSTGLNVTYTETDTYSSFSGLIRANWHFRPREKIDPYFGFGLGYRTSNWKHVSNDPTDQYEDFEFPIPFGFEATFGLRIKLTKNFHVYTEAGMAKSAIQFGFTQKF